MVSRYGGRKEPTMHCFMSHCGHPPPQHPPPPAVSQFRIISTNTGRPEVSFHVGANFPPQQAGGGGPPGGPQLRGLHPHHGANPPIPPPHQQQPPSQSQHTGGPPGPAPTSTPPGPTDMGKQGPPHLQGQAQMPQGGQMQINYGVPNQPRPNQSQTYYTGPRVTNPRLPNHRGQVVNMPTSNVGQQIFQSHVQLQQMPMYPSHVVPAPITPNPVFVGPGQIPMFSTAPSRHQGTGTGYFPPTNQQQLMMHQHQQIYPGYQSGPQGHPYYFSGVQPRPGMGGAGGPGLGGGANQQVVVPGAPPQISQGPQVPIMSGGVIVPGMTGDSTAPAGAVGSGGPIGKPARRKYAVDIVDPKTMKNIDLYESSSGSTPPRSGESSDRETPQPTTGLGAMTVAADFAARVAKAANEPSSGPSPAPPSYSEPPSSVLPAQVVNVNGPDLIMNSLVASSEGVLSQPEASISKSQIVVIEESIISTPSWKPSTQLKTPSVGMKIASGSKCNKVDVIMNKVEDQNNAKLESDFMKERERPVPPGIPSVSAKDIPPPQVADIPVQLISKEHEVTVPTQQDLTPVVSALTNSPDVDIHHRLPRDQYPSLKPSSGSVVGNSSMGAQPSPRRKRDSAANAEKILPPQTVPSVPNISNVSVPSPVADIKPREHSTPPIIPQTPPDPKLQPSSLPKKPFPSPEIPVEEIPPFVAPAPKERRDPEKSSRGREKTSHGREGDKSVQNRDKSQGHDREKSLQGRNKGSPVPMPSATTTKPQAELLAQTPRPVVAKSTSVPTPTAPPVDEPKIQTNGEMLDGLEGKAGQRPKHNRRGQPKMRDTRKLADKEGPEMDTFTEPPVDDSAPVSSSPVQPDSQELKNEDADANKDEKLIAARNEENVKVSAAALKDEPPVIENTPTMPSAIILKHNYKEDQWSPLNPEGKKKYERDFLIGLKNDPQSKKKPDIKSDLEVVLKDNRPQSRAMDMSRSQHESFTPKFMSSGNSRGGPPPQRKSQQGNKSKGNKPNVIHVSLSLKEEVKLRETENAWKPGRGKSVSDEEAKTEDLYKKVRGVLNKLTPEKFSKLVSQVQSLPIDNSDRLQGVIDLVFEKAIDEPGFSVGYAQMCKVLCTMQVPAERKTKDEPEYVNFRKLLITRCQQEFEKNNEAELSRDARFKELQNIEDAEKKKELQLQYEDEERKMRMKSVGNIRFIGELFKNQMLTVNIMHRCIRHLLQHEDEESLECLCKLLTTIGKDLDSKNQDLSGYFKRMKEISQKRGEISSRVRFMLQDVIELRQSNWVPRRDESNPKTIDQIQREAEKESLDQQIALSAAPPTPRRQEDRSGGGDRRKNRINEEGWSTAGPRSKIGYPVDATRLKQKVPEMDSLSLGNRSFYTNWTSNMKVADTSKKPSLPGISNYFSALENMPSETDKRYPLLGASSRPGTQKSASSPSTEKEKIWSSFKPQNEDARSSRGSSVQQSSRSSSRDNSIRAGSEDTQRSLSSLPVSSAASTEDMRKSPETVLAPDVSLTSDQITKKTMVLLDEYFNNSNEAETAQSVAETFGVSNITPFVVEAINGVLEKSSQARQNIGKLMCHLIKENVVTKFQFLKGFSEIVTLGDDLAIDIPKIWLYLAEIIVPLLSTETLSFSDFRDVARSVHKFVLEVLQLLYKERGPAWIREKWVAADIQWSDFIESERVDSFVKEHNLDYTLGAVSSSHSSALSKPLNMEEIQKKLVQFLKPEHPPAPSFDEICDWIGANIGDSVSEPYFIRALITAICETAVMQSPNWKLKDDVLRQHSKFFNKYVDNKEELELQCLYAVQAFVHRLEHPQGLLCCIFQILYDENFISTESFTTWQESNDPHESLGKGVALKSTTSFFTALREGEDDSEES